MHHFPFISAPMPIVPESVLRQHNVYQPGDTRFRACARLMQSLWRTSQRLPIGNHTTRRGGKRRLGSLLTEQDAQAGRNFMSPALARLARHEIAYRQPGALISVQRLLSNLLSSQPLAFNLFGNLRLYPELALPVVRHLLPDADIAQVLHVGFEFSPGRMDTTLTADRSAFDVAIFYQRRDGASGLLAIELKYSEELSQSRPGDTGDTYGDLAHSSGLFKNPASSVLRTPMFEQLFREHLLAQAAVMRGRFAEAHFILVAPQSNDAVNRGAKLYAAHLAQPLPDHVPFHIIDLDRVIDAYGVAGEPDYADALHDRYTRWSTIDAVVADALTAEQALWRLIRPPSTTPLVLIETAA